jgi:DNA-binding protein H-NS
MQEISHSPDAAEKEAALRKIRRLMDFWKIEPQELGSPLPRSAPTPPTIPQQYRHPIMGAVWNGKGAQPQWLKDALIQEGYTVEALKAPKI